jgi:hypothetical protein
LSARDVAAMAVRELIDLLGSEPTRVTGIERAGDAWKVTVEVVELERVPDTTSMMATYEVQLDDRGELLAYHRSGRYVRGRTEDR